MGKLAQVADRIRETKQKHEAEADAFMTKLDNIDAKAADTFPRVHNVIDQHRLDLNAMEEDLRQLSNFPLDKS